MATLPGAWRYRVSAGTGWPGVCILWLGEMESLICNFCLSVAAHTIVLADPSLRYTSLLLGCWATNKQTNPKSDAVTRPTGWQAEWTLQVEEITRRFSSQAQTDWEERRRTVWFSTLQCLMFHPSRLPTVCVQPVQQQNYFKGSLGRKVIVVGMGGPDKFKHGWTSSKAAMPSWT